MPHARENRIIANCKTIWGNDSWYDIEFETDDFMDYVCFVRKDLDTEYGPPLTMTRLCESEEAALAELDRILVLWAKRIKSGQAVTAKDWMEMFGRRNGGFSTLR